MPECFDCHRVRPTAEVRRTSRGGVQGFICRERHGCKITVARQKAEARADALTERELARVDRAFNQLERLRNELGRAWEASPLGRLRVARDELLTWLENHDKKEG